MNNVCILIVKALSWQKCRKKVRCDTSSRVMWCCQKPSFVFVGPFGEVIGRGKMTSKKAGLADLQIDTSIATGELTEHAMNSEPTTRTYERGKVKFYDINM